MKENQYGSRQKKKLCLVLFSFQDFCSRFLNFLKKFKFLKGSKLFLSFNPSLISPFPFQTFVRKMSTESTDSTTSQPTRQLDWFDNIENIRPVRGGHSAAAVMAAATAPIVTINEAREKFAKAFTEADAAEDPLTILVQFVKWFDDHFLSGKTRLLVFSDYSD